MSSAGPERISFGISTTNLWSEGITTWNRWASMDSTWDAVKDGRDATNCSIVAGL